jgi:hypothetical protein
MNERIRELVEQAGFYVADDKIYIPSTSEEITTCQKKFAQLLLQECINKMEQSFAGSIGTDDQNTVWGESVNSFKAWNGAIKFSREKIKEHFGVAE